MIFSEQKFPVLKTLKRGGLPTYDMGINNKDADQNEAITNMINSIIEGNKPCYISKNITNLIKDDAYGLNAKNNELFKTDMTDEGIFIIDEEITIFYKTTTLGIGVHEIQCITLFEDKTLGQAMLINVDNGVYEFKTINHTMLNDDNLELSHRLVSLLTSTIIFKKFAPIETIIINKDTNRKGKLGNEKHLNSMNIDITVIDSSWFRNIIRTSGFTVRGHFGLRSCGVNRRERRLVWIDTYKKNGYVRDAKKLAQ